MDAVWRMVPRLSAADTFAAAMYGLTDRGWLTDAASAGSSGLPVLRA